MRSLPPAVVDLGFAPREWQATCFKRAKRFSVIVVHRRGGKTVMAIMRLVDAALRCDKERGRYGYIAPLLKQAKGIAWDYLKAYARKVPGTTINEGELWVEFRNGARIRIYGADNPDALRGLYFDGVVIDEVAQTKKELWEAVVLPALSDRGGWALFIGTAKGINLFSELYYKALADPEWFAAIYNCNETDALTPDEIALAQKTMPPSIFRQEYLCDFTASSDNTLISIDDVLQATARNVLRPHFYEYAPKVLGVDVAWQGGDRCVLFPRQGLQAFQPVVEKGLPEKTFATKIARAITNWRLDFGRGDAVFVDTTGGYGGEVVSRLHDLGYPVQAVVFSWKASQDRFANLRAEMYWRAAEWVKGGGAFAKTEYSTQLQTELCALTYSNDNASNRLTLESKDHIRERIGVSPDIADAFALTFAFPVARTDTVGQRRPALEPEFDPYRSEVMA